MNKERKKKFFDSYYPQLIGVLVIIILLMMMAIVLVEDINKGNYILDVYSFLNNIYLNILLGGAVYAYSQSKKSFKFQLSFGKTRKDIFHSTFKNIAQVVIVATFISLVYIAINNHFTDTNISTFKVFKEEGLLFLLELVVLASLIGFFVGLLKLDSVIAYVIILLFMVGIFFVTLKFHGNEMINLILEILIFVFIGLDRFLVEKVKVL